MIADADLQTGQGRTVLDGLWSIPVPIPDSSLPYVLQVRERLAAGPPPG
jgi:hypothetical protein